MSIKAQQTSAFIKTNRLTGALNADGLMFDSLGNPGLYTNSINLAKNAGIWLSAKDSLGNIKVSAHNVLGSNHDFWPGPLEVLNGHSADPLNWNIVYHITADQVAYHMAHYKDASYMPSNDIANWPGSKGAPYAQILAPFVDVKVSNQIYEPATGDYPYIKCDELVYSIFNDNYAQHTYSGGAALGVEVHSSIYAFKSTDSFMKNAILVRYSVHNRSGKNYKNFRLSLVTNFQIGDESDEFLGTDIDNQAIFAINDTTGATFKNKLVSLGCMAFNQKISSTMYFNNDNNILNGRPSLDFHFYNLMQGKWKNGKALGYGGTGVDGNGTAKFIYPYTSDNTNGNIMWNEYGNTPGQRIGMLNCDSTDLNAGTAKVYDFIYFYVDEKFNNIKQISKFCLNIKEVLNTKRLLFTPKVNTTTSPKIIVFPNPIHAGDILFIKMNKEVPMTIRIVDIGGKEISNYDLHVSKNNINLPADLVSGLYFIEFKTLNTIERQLININ